MVTQSASAIAWSQDFIFYVMHLPAWLEIGVMEMTSSTGSMR